jgi:hypothetical protein
LADCLYLLGRHDDATALLDRLVGLSNDIGLLSEEYDAVAKRQVGNFPQAFSHVSLVNTAYNLSGHPEVEDATPSASLIALAPSRLRQWRRGKDARGPVLVRGRLHTPRHRSPKSNGTGEDQASTATPENPASTGSGEMTS